MAKKRKKDDEPQLSAEEMVKRELAHEKIERARAGRLLRLGSKEVVGTGIALILGLALLLYLLDAPLVLAALLGGIGAVTGAIFAVLNPFKGKK